MRRHIPGMLAAILAAEISTLALLDGCQKRTGPISRGTMTALSPRVQTLFDQTRIVCFGRFVIKIPATATVVYGPAEVEAPIEYLRGDGDKVSEHLAARVAEIDEERTYLLKDDIPKLPLFGKIIDGAVPGQKIVFGSKDQASYAIYSFVPVGKDLFVQHLNTVLPKNERVSMFNRVASHLRSRSESDIPAEPGTCIEGGFIPLEQKYERVTIGVRLQEFPDVHISLDVHKNLDRLREGNSPKLLREQAKESAEAAGLGAIFAQAKVLRQQERQLANWHGEEIALRIPAYKDETDAHEFRFHSMGALNDPLLPELDIRLDSGVKDDRKASVRPSITDEEALALWEKIISTIRLRQPGDATQNSTAPTRIPLASMATTGELCPETGWWECIEGKTIEGGRRRLLMAGETMPHALMPGELGLWQKLFGGRTNHQIATKWKLVEYAVESAAPSPQPMSPADNTGSDHA